MKLLTDKGIFNFFKKLKKKIIGERYLLIYKKNEKTHRVIFRSDKEFQEWKTKNNIEMFFGNNIIAYNSSLYGAGIIGIRKVF